MILITGYNGFIGGYLRNYLVNEKSEWSIGYDESDGNDIRNKYKLDKAVSDNNVDTVYHLAAVPGVRKSEEFSQEYISTNITGTKNVVDVCEKHDVENLIFFSSSSVYGGENPPFDEKQKHNPKSMYAITKETGEQIVKNANICKKAIVRPFIVYGERGRPDQVIYKWIYQARKGKDITFYGDGTTKRGYTNVNDLVRGVYKLLGFMQDQESGFFEDYNIGGDEVISLEEVLDIYKDYGVTEDMVKRMDVPDSDVRESYADISKAKQDFGFEPELEFEESLREILDYELGRGDEIN